MAQAFNTIFNFCVLNSYFESTFGPHYSKDVIMLINKVFNSLFVLKISCGGNHTIALTPSNDIYVWGDNEFGQLGLGDNINRNIPTLLSQPSWNNIKQIVCGNSHSMLLTYSNDIYVWGSNSWGQLGLGDNIDRNIPQRLLSPEIKVKKIYSEELCSALITESDEAYVWGANGLGQLGIGNEYMQNTPRRLLLSQPGCDKIKDIKCGDIYSIALTHSNEVYVWGCMMGQLRIKRDIPQKLSFSASLTIKQIDRGTNHVLVTTNSNERYFIRYENGEYVHQKLDVSNIKQILPGRYYTTVLTYTKQVYAWANNKLSISENYKQQEPRFQNVKEIFRGDYHFIAITENSDEIYIIGKNNKGQLGLGDFYDRLLPTKLELFTQLSGEI